MSKAAITGTSVEIPFLSLERAAAEIREELEATIAAVVASGRYVLGKECAAFEDEFAATVGVDHAVGVASGTDALELALRALPVAPGDEVVTQANTCPPTVTAIERAGATPVLCDVEPEGATLDVGSLNEAIGPRTRAIVPVHLYGQCADVDAIAELVDDRGIAIIEDCAHAHGAELRGRPAGTLGAAASFSFYPTKNLGALGDAGAVCTGDAGIAKRARTLRNHGLSDRVGAASGGVNSRLDEIQAAVLRLKLKRLEDKNRRRAEIASTYAAALDGTLVRPLRAYGDRRHAFHLFVVLAPDRDEFVAGLEQRGVGTSVHYPRPIHHHPAFARLGDGLMGLENAELLCRRVVSLPLYPELTDAEVQTVAGAVRESALA